MLPADDRGHARAVAMKTLPIADQIQMRDLSFRKRRMNQNAGVQHRHGDVLAQCVRSPVALIAFIIPWPKGALPP